MHGEVLIKHGLFGLVQRDRSSGRRTQRFDHLHFLEFRDRTTTRAVFNRVVYSYGLHEVGSIYEVEFHPSLLINTLTASCFWG